MISGLNVSGCSIKVARGFEIVTSQTPLGGGSVAVGGVEGDVGLEIGDVAVAVGLPADTSPPPPMTPAAASAPMSPVMATIRAVIAAMVLFVVVQNGSFSTRQPQKHKD